MSGHYRRRRRSNRERRHTARRARSILLRVAIAVLLVGGASAAVAFWPTDPIRVKRAALAKGDKYFQQKKFVDAILQYKIAVKTDPQFGDAHARLAEAYAQIDDSRNAFKEYVTAADLRPEDVPAQIHAGNALLLMGYAKEAGERANRVLAVDPNNFDAKLLHANVTAGLRNLDDAVVQMYRLVDSVGDRPADQARALLHLGVMELAQGHASDAEGVLRKASVTDLASVTNHIALANYYWAVNRRPDAENELKRVLSVDPTDPRANRALAALYIAGDRVADAEAPLKVLAASSTEPGARFVLADYYIVAHRVDEAGAILHATAQDTAFYAQSQIRLALIEYEAGRMQRAEDILDATLRKEPTHPAVLLMKARLLAERHAYDQAFARVTAALAVEPKSAEAQYLLGTIYSARNQPDEAIAAFTQVLKLRPNLVDALVRLSSLHLARSDPDNAARFAVQAVTNAPSSATARIALFRALLARGNVVEAEREVRPVVDANPAAPIVVTQWGRLLAAKGDAAGARQYLTDAIRLDGKLFEPLSELVSLELGAHRATEVLPFVADRLARLPDDAPTLLLAAHVYAALGDSNHVEAALKRVVELDPSNLRAFGALGQFYYAAGRVPDARRQFEALAAQNPRSVGALTMLAMIEELEGKPADAERTYERALTIDANAAVASNNLAWLQLKRHANLDVALQHAQAAKAAFPNEPEFNDTLGWIYVQKEMLDLALLPLLDSVRAAPENAGFRFHLGMAYVERGDHKLARAHLERAISLHQDFEGIDEAKRQLERLRLMPADTKPADPNK